MLSGKISNKSDLMSGENFKKADSKPKKYPAHSKNHLKPVFNNCHKVQFQRNLKYRLSEQMTHFPILGIIIIFLKVLILDPKIPILLHFGHNKKFSQKRTASQFCVYPCKLHVKIHAKKLEKSNESILRKRRQRRTDG